MRIFTEAPTATLHTRIYLDSASDVSAFTIEVQQGKGLVPVRLYFKHNGEIIVKNGGRYDTWGTYVPKEWIDLTITVNCYTNLYTLTLNQCGASRSKNFRFNNSVYTVERILFASKDILPFNTIEDCGKWGDLGDLEQADTKLPESHYYIDYLTVERTTP